jgi:hypothetical protein
MLVLRSGAEVTLYLHHYYFGLYWSNIIPALHKTRNELEISQQLSSYTKVTHEVNHRKVSLKQSEICLRWPPRVTFKPGLFKHRAC